MRPGDLVRIRRASIGVPMDSLAMIVKIERHVFAGHGGAPQLRASTLFKVLFLTDKVHPAVHKSSRRYWSQDLEVVSAER